MARRMINAEPGAFGAIRVMVNLNQLGEAAEVAAYLALENNCPVDDVDISMLRQTLEAGGFIIT